MEPASPPLVSNEKLTKDDVTEHERSPVEHAFYESFLLQSRSDIENLYASNIYWSQKHAKEVKDLNRQKMVTLSSMTKEQKEMVKRMQKLQEKQEQLLDVKLKQYKAAKEKNCRRLRPQSTSAVPNSLRVHPEPRRPRSGSSSFLDVKSDLSRSCFLSKSSQNLSQLSTLEVGKDNLKAMSKSCEDLSQILGTSIGKSKKLELPAIQPTSRSKSSENLSDDDSFFITTLDQTSSKKTFHKKTIAPVGLLSPAGFNPERRRGSLPNPDELERQLDLERHRSNVEDESLLTHAKWVPKSCGRSLPPL